MDETKIEIFKMLRPEEYFKQHVEQEVRVDGRGSLTSMRPVSVVVGNISSADGSAIVKKGETIMTCGIKLELASPKPETPNCGYIIPNVELPSICHSKFKHGAPSKEAQIASKFLEEVLTNSKVINLEDLCIKKGELVWVLYLDLMCLNHDGNVLDVALEAAIAALADLKLPKVSVEEDDEENGIDVNPDKTTTLKLKCYPVSCTLGILDGKIISDPTLEEENYASTLLTLVLDSRSSNDILLFNKPGGAPITREVLQQCTSLAKKQSRNIQKLLDKSTSAKILNK